MEGGRGESQVGGRAGEVEENLGAGDRHHKVLISIFQLRWLSNKHLFAFYNNSYYTLFRSGITFTFSNIVREDPEKKFR